MKSFAIAAAVVVLVSACSDKKDQPAAPVAAAVPVGSAKPDTARPAALPATLAATTDCSLESFNGGPRADLNTVTDKSKVYLNGWAGPSTGDKAPGDIFIELTGPAHYFVKGERGIERPDVAEHFKKPALRNAGWSVTMDVSGFAAGSYALKVLEVSGGAGTQCEPNASIVIGG